jgi:two-component system, OmpR family, alkaline phosphatase synthesis response regulator PhoP
MSEEKQKTKIVLAEDEEFIVRATNSKLELEGFQVIVAHDGEEAIARILSEKPDIVLLDLIMPKKTGFEVLKELLNHPEVQGIPIIVASNLGQASDVEEAKRLGAIDYLVKSDLSMKEMVEKIKEHLPEDKRPVRATPEV